VGARLGAERKKKEQGSEQQVKTQRESENLWGTHYKGQAGGGEEREVQVDISQGWRERGGGK